MAGDYDTVPLGEVASVRSGFAFKSSDWTESGIPVVKIANVKDGSLVMEACSFVPYSVAALASEFALQAGDILIAMTGYIGDVALVRERNLPAVLNQRVGRFTVRNPRRLDQRFIFYLLRDADVPKEIEVNRRMSEKLEGIARALFESWFVRFDPVRRNMARKGQGQPSLGLRPPSPSGKGVGVRVWPKALLSIKSTRSSLPRHDSVTSVSPPLIKSQKSCVLPGVVLLSKLNPETERVWLVDVDKDDQAVCSMEVLVLRPRPHFGRGFSFYLARSPLFRQGVKGLVTGTSKSHQGAHAPSILALPVVLPSLAATQAFERQAEPLLTRSPRCRRESRTLAALHDSLLPKLISGEIRIKDAERFLKERGL